MAYATVETRIQNPAGRRNSGGKKNVARKMTAKQIRFFGTKRQKAALRAKRRPAKRRHNAAPKRNPAKPAARRNPVRRNPPRKNPKRNTARHHKRRRNPIPEIISLTMGNPAKRSNMAATKKNRAHKRRRNPSAASRRNAGARRSNPRKRHHHRHHYRRNPAGLGQPMDWIKGGVGVIGGAVGARVIPQLAGSANTGGMGYAMNLAATLGMGFLAHMIAKDPVITASVIAGGMAGTLVRIATDNTTYGSYLALSGVGDYVVWNYSQPQRVTGPNASMIDSSWRMAAAQAQSPMIAGSIDKFRG